MSKRYLVVGGVAGGASVAARIRRLDENADIVIFDKGPDVSFSNCCLPNYFSGEVENTEDLVLFSPPVFKAKFNLEARVNSEVVKILPDEHKIVVKNLTENKEYEEKYDYLILSPGARAVMPRSIEGIDGENVFSIKNVANIRAIDGFMKKNGVKNVVVVGGGFIGVEASECLKHSGKNVTLVEAQNQIMIPFDEDMAQMLHKAVYDNGINLLLGETVTAISKNAVTLKSGKKIDADMVIMAIGVRPDIQVAIDAGVEQGETGSIKVDQKYRTNIKDVYAVGDAIEVSHSITKKKTRLPLAGPAQRQARSCADGIFGRTVQNRGVIGSAAIRIFGINAARTGLNEAECTAAGIDYLVSYVMPNDKVGLMPTAKPLHLKLIFENPTGKILGAQAVGPGDATKRIDIIAAMITMGAYLEDLKELELCYAPPFSTAKDVTNFAALVGLNILNGEYKQVRMKDVRDLVEQNAFIIDVRDKDSYDESHITTAINIPMGEIRTRTNEIPKDKPVYIHCRTSWYSYYICRALQGLGFDNIINIQGSFLGLSNYEYFRDQTTERKPILTGYNFN